MSNLPSFSQKLLWMTPSKLPEEMIVSMRKYVEEQIKHTVAGVDGRPCERNELRSSMAGGIPWDEWIPGIILNMMIAANREYFRYELDYFSSRIQSTIYYGDQKDFYTWHCDNGSNSVKPTGMERKLSCSLLLSDPSEYEGGEFQIHYERSYFKSLRPEKGQCIIFPAWVPHRVRPIKSGKRISLVAWMEGPMFR